MHRTFFLLGSLAILAGVSACDMTARSSQEFALPEGNAGKGQQAFISLQCTACHRLHNLELPAPEIEGPVMIVLGGGVSKVKSYSELVTSIINPSHRLARGIRKDEISAEGESLMANYNDVMTVTELTDLVAFLQSQYEIRPRPGYRYPVYEYKRAD
jgi:hypothetical protein